MELLIDYGIGYSFVFMLTLMIAFFCFYEKSKSFFKILSIMWSDLTTIFYKQNRKIKEGESSVLNCFSWILYILLNILSPTFFFANLNNIYIGKTPCHSEIEEKKANAKKLYNIRYFLFSFFFICILSIIELLINNLSDTWELEDFSIYFYDWNKYFVIPFTIYLFSRCLEIFYAFGKDAVDKLSNSKSNTNLKFFERIKLSLRSYIELIINYALLYYFIKVICINYNLGLPFNDLNSVFDSIYYSSLIITTIGFDLIKPTMVVTKFLSFFQVFNGMILVIVSFTIYVSRSISENENKNENKNENTYYCTITPI